MAEHRNPAPAAYRNAALVVDHPATELANKAGGGSPRKVFKTDAGHRQAIVGQWEEAASETLKRAKRAGLKYGVVKVELLSEALAKSHRPHYLFEQAGRGRVIGGAAIGTLLVSVSETSLAATAESITDNKTQSGIADVSTITRIAPFGGEDVIRGAITASAFAKGAVVRLFDFQEEVANEEAVAALMMWCQNEAAGVTAFGTNRYHVTPKRAKDLNSLASLPCVREIVPNATVYAPTTGDTDLGKRRIASPKPDTFYSTVGLLDSGIAQVKAIQPWLSAQTQLIQLPAPAPPVDYAHGTFIGGVLIGGSALTGAGQVPPIAPVKIVDVRVYSGVEQTDQVDLTVRIGQALQAHPDVRVWNLSLGVPGPLKGPEFSTFARELDEYSRRYDVLFVIAAGNYEQPSPLRAWPPANAPIADAISSPADSVLGLTVGSIAHASTVKGVKAGEPTPYSRRGPGPAAVPKPEVVHYGGGCDLQGGTSEGVSSLSPWGSATEAHGTSFAAPQIAALSAQCWDFLRSAGHTPTPAMVKALIVHAAAVHAPRRTADELHYYGFGVPEGLNPSLLCTDDMFTTLHTVHVPRGQEIHHHFPMPACLLSGGKFRGEVVITLCYRPLLNEASGAEYCRSNVSVAMGPITKNKTTKKNEFHGKVPPDPKNHGEAFESALIDHGFKWSPLKVYRRRFPQGVQGTHWELRFDTLYRAGQPIPAEPHEAFAIVTVRGFDEAQPVYRDGVRALAKQSHRFRELRPNARTRVRRQ